MYIFESTYHKEATSTSITGILDKKKIELNFSIAPYVNLVQSNSNWMFVISFLLLLALH